MMGKRIFGSKMKPRCAALMDRFVTLRAGIYSEGGPVMSKHAKPSETPNEQIGGTPSPGNVTKRAEGRPPEESSSDNPTEQAEAILQESEDRVAEGAAD